MLKKAFFDRIIITQPSGFVKEQNRNSTYYINTNSIYCEKHTKEEARGKRKYYGRAANVESKCG